MYDVSTQGVDERMINVHYYYVHYYYYLSENAEKAQQKTPSMIFTGNVLSTSLFQYSPCYFYAEYYPRYTSTTLFTAITKLMFQILRKRRRRRWKSHSMVSNVCLLLLCYCYNYYC